jgi:predicted HTH transcriptional regulator
MLKTETNRSEYKEKLTDALEKEVVAFLNAKGGDICIGIKKDGSVIGVKNPDELQLKIKDRLINNICPSIMGLFDVLVEEIENKAVVIVNLAGGTENPYYIKKYGRSEAGCFIRIGSSSQPMTEKMIEGFMSKRHPSSLAHMLSHHQDLTFRQLKIYYESKGLRLNEEFAKSLDFLTKDGKYNQLAYLFSDVNRISIRIGKYAGKDKAELIQNEEYGDQCLIAAMQKVMNRLDVENITQARKRYPHRIEKKYIDKDALREVIINAFAHNDYVRADTPIFEIFSNRFEITSYGGLVEGLTEENFFSGVSRPRNREIMRVFKDLDFVEQLGSGMPYIVDLYGRESFKFLGCAIRVILKFDTDIETTKKTTKKTTDKIIEAIVKNPNVSASELVESLHLTLHGINWNLKKLKEQNKIRRVGADKGGYWEVIEKE